MEAGQLYGHFHRVQVGRVDEDAVRHIVEVAQLDVDGLTGRLGIALLGQLLTVHGSVSSNKRRSGERVSIVGGGGGTVQAQLSH